MREEKVLDKICDIIRDAAEDMLYDNWEDRPMMERRRAARRLLNQIGRAYVSGELELPGQFERFRPSEIPVFKDAAKSDRFRDCILIAIRQKEE